MRSTEAARNEDRERKERSQGSLGSAYGEDCYYGQEIPAGKEQYAKLRGRSGWEQIAPDCDMGKISE
jgi:hypothetical protein